MLVLIDLSQEKSKKKKILMEDNLGGKETKFKNHVHHDTEVLQEQNFRL